MKACFRKITLSTDFVCLYSAAAIVLQTGKFLTQPTFSLYMYLVLFSEEGLVTCYSMQISQVTTLFSDLISESNNGDSLLNQN